MSPCLCLKNTVVVAPATTTQLPPLSEDKKMKKGPLEIDQISWNAILISRKQRHQQQQQYYENQGGSSSRGPQVRRDELDELRVSFEERLEAQQQTIASQHAMLEAQYATIAQLQQMLLQALHTLLKMVISLGDEYTLVKVGLFVLVQALVYFILTSSSNIFSQNKNMKPSLSFKTVRSASIRRFLAVLSDVPAEQASPSSKAASLSPSRKH
ncbi:hypothetical protein Sjap_008885 [Stephania japonica]|uniref:Uncharacterized protein n=1 Tax=Stephania japonica TaxID=461633 RepID=A0AAP0JQE7_9MAGN